MTTTTPIDSDPPEVPIPAGGMPRLQRDPNNAEAVAAYAEAMKGLVRVAPGTLMQGEPTLDLTEDQLREQLAYRQGEKASGNPA